MRMPSVVPQSSSRMISAVRHLSTLFDTTYDHDTKRVYNWGYLAVRYLVEKHPEDVAAFRERHKLPDRFVLYLGTIQPRKNLERLLQAFDVCFARIYHQVVVRSACNLPREGPAILVCNHISGLDPMLIQSVLSLVYRTGEHDTVGRVVGSPGEISVGIVTAALGGPVFVALVRRGRIPRL